MKLEHAYNTKSKLGTMATGEKIIELLPLLAGVLVCVLVIMLSATAKWWLHISNNQPPSGGTCQDLITSSKSYGFDNWMVNNGLFLGIGGVVIITGFGVWSWYQMGRRE